MTHAKKMNAAAQALPHVKHAQTIGIGTGSTVECLIQLLAEEPWAHDRDYVVSSQRSARALRAHGFERIHAPDAYDALELYIDGADWIDPQGIAIKGYGGALTQEKLLASMSVHRVAIVDEHKIVTQLNLCQPIPIEILTVGRAYVHKVLSAHGRLVYRKELSDQDQSLADLYDLVWHDPEKTERWLNSISGVIECGLFALHPFHDVLIGR